MTRVHVATGNAGKLAEFTAVLQPLGFTVEGPPTDFDVIEDGDSFVANAVKKAHALMQRTQQPTVADDSGLEVDALQGAPGVHSARYAGVTGSEHDMANRRKLLAAMSAMESGTRAARFICVIAYCAPDRAPVLFSGTVLGHIAKGEAGQDGFGYDPLFVPAGETQTFAEMPAARKHAISHRGQALRALAAFLKRAAPG